MIRCFRDRPSRIALLLAITISVSIVIMSWAAYLLIRHTSSAAVGAIAMFVSFLVAVLLLQWCYGRSAAIGAALSVLGAALAAGEVSHRFAGAPRYAPHGVLSLAAGAGVGFVACLVVYFVRHCLRERVRNR